MIRSTIPVRRVFALGIFGVATFAAAAPLLAQTAGYAARPSGFDLNFNGVVGEAGTADQNVCNGIGNETSTTGKDIDGNGVADRQVYVDLTGGSDNTACGLPGSPCRTIAYAMNGSNTDVVGGPIQNPAPAQIQALCFKGIGRETVVPTVSGAAGTYSLPQAGRQSRSFNLPRYPFILSGWDANQNKQYPPYDAGDTALIDCTLGGSASLPYAIDNTLNFVSNIEYAHFSVAHCGQMDRGSGGDTHEGFMNVCSQGQSCSQIYVHDLNLADIMKAEQNESYHEVFNMFTGSLTYFNVTNINVTNVGGGYFARGAGPPGTTVGPYRFQNISATVFGFTDTNGSCPGTVGGAVECTWSGFKLWDYLTGVEVIDNDFNLNPSAWTPHAVGGAGSVFVTADYCVQDWVIRGNKATDFKQFVSVAPYYGSPGQCESRPVDGIVVDRNIFRNSYAAWQFGDWGIQILPGKDTIDTARNVTITNNFLSSVPGWEACVWANGGNPVAPQGGVVTVAEGRLSYGN